LQKVDCTKNFFEKLAAISQFMKLWKNTPQKSTTIRLIFGGMWQDLLLMSKLHSVFTRSTQVQGNTKGLSYYCCQQ